MLSNLFTIFNKFMLDKYICKLCRCEGVNIEIKDSNMISLKRGHLF